MNVIIVKETLGLLFVLQRVARLVSNSRFDCFVNRIFCLQSVRSAKPYEKQKCSLYLELEAFLTSLPTPKSTTSAPP